MLEKRKPINLLRASILLLILPVMYISLWISISAKEMLTYSEKVMLLMSYVPEFARNPYGLTIFFFGMSGLSAGLSFSAWMKSKVKRVQYISMVISAIGTILALWFLLYLL